MLLRYGSLPGGSNASRRRRRKPPNKGCPPVAAIVLQRDEGGDHFAFVARQRVVSAVARSRRGAGEVARSGLVQSRPSGHTLFPLLAMLLSNGTIGEALVAELEATGRDPLESFAMTEEEPKPKLATPSMVALIQGGRPGSR